MMRPGVELIIMVGITLCTLYLFSHLDPFCRMEKFRFRHEIEWLLRGLGIKTTTRHFAGSGIYKAVITKKRSRAETKQILLTASWPD